MKVQALFKSGKTASKPAPAKKATSAPRQSSGKKTGGWLGTGSQQINLDKW
jgi:hypothetical protein